MLPFKTGIMIFVCQHTRMLRAYQHHGVGHTRQDNHLHSLYRYQDADFYIWKKNPKKSL